MASASLSSLYASASLSSSYSVTSSYAESVFSAKVLCQLSASGTSYYWAGYNVQEVHYKYTGSLTGISNPDGRFLIKFSRPLKPGYVAIANGSHYFYPELPVGSYKLIAAGNPDLILCSMVDSGSLYVETWQNYNTLGAINNINIVVYGEWSGSGSPITYQSAIEH